MHHVNLSSATISFIATALLGISFFVVRDLRRSSADQAKVLSSLVPAVASVEMRCLGAEAREQRIESALRSLKNDIAELSDKVRNASPTAASSRERAIDGGAQFPDDRPDLDALKAMALLEEPLPQSRALNLADGLDPSRIVEETDLQAILADRRLNPDNRTPSFAESTKAVSILRQAKAVKEILDAEILRVLAEGGDAMRREGAYVTYQPGEAYIVEPETLTFAEQAEDGSIRMFYFYEDEYPDLYVKQRLRDSVASRAVEAVSEIVGGARVLAGSSEGARSG